MKERYNKRNEKKRKAKNEKQEQRKRKEERMIFDTCNVSDHLY